MTILKREDDSSWKAYRDIFNSNKQLARSRIASGGRMPAFLLRIPAVRNSARCGDRDAAAGGIRAGVSRSVLRRCRGIAAV